MNITNFGKGALIQPTTIRDYRLELAGATILPPQFSLRDKVGAIKNQDGSLSCVGQTFAYYAELLNTIETGVNTPMSARDIYSLIFQFDGGAFLKDAASKICNTGVIPENDAVSYIFDGIPPTEAYMRSRNGITQLSEDEGYNYWAYNYVTWNKTNLDLYKQAIVQGNGCAVACGGNNYAWQNTNILVLDSNVQIQWSHSVLLIGYDDVKKVFIFVNSWGANWGDGGFGYLPYDYITKGYVSNPITLIDLPNGRYYKYMSIFVNLKDRLSKVLKLLNIKL